MKPPSPDRRAAPPLGTPEFLSQEAYLVRREPAAGEPAAGEPAAGEPAAGEPEEETVEPLRTWRRWTLPALLFTATLASTWYVQNLAYAASLMAILTAHELGHFLQARRYGVLASPPYFVPMPFTPLGTMGAIIAMRSRTAPPRALFDIAVAGPLAGLVPTLALLVVGLKLSRVSWALTTEPPWLAGKPLLFQALETLLLGSAQYGQKIAYHPLAVAAWTGLFITALNLIPIGQLDGGHILHTLFRRGAYAVSGALALTAGVVIVVGGYWEWSLLWVILVLMGVRHPPTLDDGVSLGTPRVVLGIATLLFVIVGFTPSPFAFR